MISKPFIASVEKGVRSQLLQNGPLAGDCLFLLLIDSTSVASAPASAAAVDSISSSTCASAADSSSSLSSRRLSRH